MSKGSKTSLFISSTCYDLTQIRADLRDFSASIGFDPIMSEYDTFPVNPSQDTRYVLSLLMVIYVLNNGILYRTIVLKQEIQ